MKNFRFANSYPQSRSPHTYFLQKLCSFPKISTKKHISGSEKKETERGEKKLIKAMLIYSQFD